MKTLIFLTLFLAIFAVSFLFALELDDNIEIDYENKVCECIKYDCGCCAHLLVKKFHLDSTICSNFTYLPDEYGISVTVTYNDIDIINETISAKNPPPLCAIHIDEVHLEVCLRFSDLDYDQGCFSGCAEFDVKVLKINTYRLKLGCFKQCGLPELQETRKNALSINYSNSLATFLQNVISQYLKKPAVILI